MPRNNGVSIFLRQAMSFVGDIIPPCSSPTPMLKPFWRKQEKDEIAKFLKSSNKHVLPIF